MTEIAEALIEEFTSAISNGNKPAVKNALAIHGSALANVIHRPSGHTPCHFAVLAQSGDEVNAQMLELLLRHGATPEIRDSDQQTVLFYACREGHIRCVEMLLAHGLKLEDQDTFGQTPIFYAASENKITLVEKFYSEATHLVGQVDKLASQTALFYSAKKGHLDMSKLLISQGCDLTHTDAQGKTAADQARKAKWNIVADYLSAELKRIKEISRTQQVSGQDSQQQDKKKKKDQSQSAVKLTYKVVCMNDRGEARDVSEDEMRKLFIERPKLEHCLKNPQSMSENDMKAGQMDTWTKFAQQTLQACWRLKGALWFNEPVDPARYNIMDYFDIIEKPMDLSTIKKKLSHNVYENAFQFADDIQLIWQNCYRYNGEGHEISRCAKELEECFSKQVKTTNLGQYLKR